jgi:DNA-binding transcriptional regulator YiaG
MTAPHAQRVRNHTLRAVRLAMRLSQAEFAAAIRRAGAAAGEPNTCDKRLVQKWESGEHATCRPNYRRALQLVTRRSYDHLGFAGGPVLPSLVSTALQPVLTDGASVSKLTITIKAGDQPCYSSGEPDQAGSDAVRMAEIAVAQMLDLEHHKPAAPLPTVATLLTIRFVTLLAGTCHEPLEHQLAAVGELDTVLARWLVCEQDRIDIAQQAWDNTSDTARQSMVSAMMSSIGESGFDDD